jgi:hypothetical protein
MFGYNLEGLKISVSKEQEYNSEKQRCERSMNAFKVAFYEF